MTAVSVRYIVDDVDAAIAFYTERLGFTVELHPAPRLRHALARRPSAVGERFGRTRRGQPAHA
jgi:catechol 2,3-dioxygenase-like lactoylglutathione lyase family enzyme